MKKTVFLFLLLSSIYLYGYSHKSYELQSPNQTIKLTVTLDSVIQFVIAKNGETVVSKAQIGLSTLEKGFLGKKPKLLNTERLSYKDEIQTPLYKKKKIDDEYNQLLLKFKPGYQLIFRCYNEGVAYRFVSKFRDSLTIINEEANYQFPNHTKGYAAYSNKGSEGDFASQYFNSFENTYDYQPLGELNSKRLIFLPMLIAIPNSSTKICITESDLEDYPGMFVHTTKETTNLTAHFAPRPKQTKQGGHNLLQQLVQERFDYIARTKGNRAFPWRAFIISDQDEQLLNSDMVYQLAQPNRLTSFDWIKPGKVAWDWWNNWNIRGVDFRAGINNDTYKYYIDFAAQHHIRYVILDEGWAVNKKADLFEVIPEINLQELIEYGRQRNVDIILWAGYWAFHRDMEKVAKHYSAMGVKGFKIDFMDRDDQNMIQFMWDAAEICAKYQLIVDYHGVCKPFGLQRTYPNVINYEGINGLEQLKWAKEGYDQVSYDVIFPFIRMVAGYVDYTQGAMRNANRKNFRAISHEAMSQGTRCRQLAEYVVFESPFNMLCDNPSNYMDEKESTEFIATVPEIWDETRTMQSKIGEYISIARRKDASWYIAALTNWDARDLVLDLSWLPDGDYEVHYFRDGINADRVACDYKKGVDKLAANKQIKINLKPGGGYVAKLVKL